MKRVLTILVMMFLFFTTAAHAKSSDSYVDVKIAPFDVRINNVLIQNVINQYPLIVYNDITYFPMTYHDSRFLGVNTNWTAKDGLSVQKGESGGYHVYDTYINDLSKSYKSRVVNLPVKVNGKLRSGGKYPFLSFRNVTYFPLTWEYAVSEFGWQYSWVEDKGLTIQTNDYEKSEQETVLNMINRTAFSKQYSFKFQFEGEQRNSLFLDGTMKSTFRAIGSNNICLFNASFELSPSYKYAESEELLGWGHEYLCNEAKWSSIEVNASYPVGISDHPLLQNQFAILGEMRKAVNGVSKTLVDSDSENNLYLITFKPDSIWANRKVEVEITKDNQVKKVTTEDKDYLGKYKVQIALNDILKH